MKKIKLLTKDIIIKIKLFYYKYNLILPTLLYSTIGNIELFKY